MWTKLPKPNKRKLVSILRNSEVLSRKRYIAFYCTKFVTDARFIAKSNKRNDFLKSQNSLLHFKLFLI